MENLKGIFLASIATPILVLSLFIFIGIVFYISDINLTGFNDFKPILGMLYAGSIYSFGAAIISFPATFLIGLPLIIFAQHKNALRKSIILTGSSITGAAVLIIASITYLQELTFSIFAYCGIIGAIGGLFNGYVFSEYIYRSSSKDKET